MNYWKECILEAFDAAGISATAEQVEEVAGWVEGAHDNYGMAHGYDAIPSPVESEAKRQLEKLQREIEEKRIWELTTTACRNCATTGAVRDGWGRNVDCPNCYGKGRF